MKRVPFFLLPIFLGLACGDSNPLQPDDPVDASLEGVAPVATADESNGAEFRPSPTVVGIGFPYGPNYCMAGVAADENWQWEIGQSDWTRITRPGSMTRDIYEHFSAPIKVLWEGDYYTGFGHLKFIDTYHAGVVSIVESVVGKVTGPSGGDFHAECKQVRNKNGLQERFILVYPDD